MTPERARELLDGTTPGPWEVRDDAGLLAVASNAGAVAIDATAADAALLTAAPDMANFIGGMRAEWGVLRCYLDRHHVADWGYDTRAEAAAEAERGAHDRDVTAQVVRRYVTAPEYIG